jgi:spoIIIJ-associated protein
MNPSERRIVHMFLRDNPRVTTFSEGTGEQRRVKITPTYRSNLARFT